ncbi:MAG: rhodanese-like domain-containing protein [Candidatus Hodarchaeales archaeon]|jgi:rhodanese-related sulfurtransferase
MENQVEIKEVKVKEVKISKVRMALKMTRLFLWTIRKRTWFLPDLEEITVDELHDRMDSNSNLPLLIDTRGEKGINEAFDFKGKKFGHIPNSQPVSVMKLATHFEDLPKDTEIVTICPGGGMSLVAVDVLEAADFSNVKSLKGGLMLWEKKGYPLEITSNGEKNTPNGE